MRAVRRLARLIRRDPSTRAQSVESSEPLKVRWVPPRADSLHVAGGQVVDPTLLNDWIAWEPQDTDPSDASGTAGALIFSRAAWEASGTSGPRLEDLLRQRPEFAKVRQVGPRFEVTLSQGVTAVLARLVALSLLYGLLRQIDQQVRVSCHT